MTKTTKQLIEEFSERPTFKDVCYEDFAQVIEALKEAIEIISEKDALDKQAFGNYYEKQNPLAGQWLKKHGFEESNSEAEIEDDPEAMTATIDKWMG